LDNFKVIVNKTCKYGVLKGGSCVTCF